MKIRAYTPDDFPLVEQWAKARGMTLIPHLLGPRGFVVEDEQGPMAVAFVYLTFDVPLAFIDNLFTRPGTSIRKCREGWPILWRTIQAYLSNLRDCNGDALNYNVVRIFCRSPLARFIGSDWVTSDHDYKQSVFLRHG